VSEGIAVSSRQRAVARAYGREAILRKDQGRVRSQVLISPHIGMWLFAPRRDSGPHSDNPVYQELRAFVPHYNVRHASGDSVFPLANRVGVGVRSMILVLTTAADLLMDCSYFVLDYVGLLSSNPAHADS